MSDSGFDIDAFIVLLSRLDFDGLSGVLDSILKEPNPSFERLEIFSCEVGLMLTRVMFLRDYESVRGFVDALERPLAEAGIRGADHEEALRAWPPEERERTSYYFGRLVGLLVIAKRFLVLDPLERLRKEYLNGGLAQSILEHLRESGPRNQKSIQTVLRHQPDGGIRVNRAVLVSVLKRLRHDDLIEQRGAGAGSALFALTPFGLSLLDAEPPWLQDVAQAYRVHRSLKPKGIGTATHNALVELFVRLDRVAGHESPEPAERPQMRAFPYVDMDEVPDADNRGLPRIIR